MRRRGWIRRRRRCARRCGGCEAPPRAGIAPGGELLAEAGDDEEGVVDAERQAHHRADDEGERVDPHEGAEQDEDAAAGEDGHRAEEKRNRRRDQGAKDQQQDDDQQRGGEQLGALGGAQRFLLQGPGDRRESGLRRRHGRVDAGGEGAFERRYGVANRRRERQVVVDQDEGAIAARGEGQAGAPCSQGEIVVAARSRRSAATRRGPWRSIAAAGPRSMTANGTDSPKFSRASASPRDEEVPGMAREVGCRWPLDAEADDAKDGDDDQRREKEDQRQAAHRLRRAAWGVGASDLAEALPSFHENVTDESI